MKQKYNLFLIYTYLFLSFSSIFCHNIKKTPNSLSKNLQTPYQKIFKLPIKKSSNSLLKINYLIVIQIFFVFLQHK
jgi:hypothetical protein